MKPQTTSLLIAALGVLGTCRAENGVARHLSLAAKRVRSLQGDIPVVGVKAVNSTVSFDGSTYVSEKVETDDQVTDLLMWTQESCAVSDVVATYLYASVNQVELGELICDDLEDVADAPVLVLAITNNEVITAEQISFTVISEEEIEDGMGRMVWTGEVVDPELTAEETSRIVTLTYAEECTAETFLMTVTTEFTDGTTEVLRSIPCDVGGMDICLVESMVDFLPVGDPADLLPDPSTFTNGTSTNSTISIGGRRLRSTRSVRRLSNNAKQAERELQSTTIISVMFLFTPEAQAIFGDVSIAQIVSFILAGLALVNDAFDNSEIPLEFAPVFIGMAPFNQPETTPAALIELTFNEEVAALRDSFEADLVQLIGGFSDLCSLGWQFPGGCDFGFSVVSPNCFAGFSHTNAFGRNLGCFADRDNSPVQTEFSHGFQACGVASPFHTIMGVECDTVESGRINFFSNPDVNFLGIFPTGTPTDNNALQIIETMTEISLCRSLEPTHSPIPSLPTPEPMTLMPPTPEFLACYTDTVASRVLSGPAQFRNRLQSTEVCAEFCEDFTFFGTEFGNECFCGVETDTPSELGPATCDFLCEGDVSQICGGFNAISVYQLKSGVGKLG